MIHYGAEIHLFYPMLFATIIVIGIITGLVIVKCKDSKLFQNIFYKSADTSKEVTIDTTSKMKDMHDNIVRVDFTPQHEKELDHLERKIDKMEKDIIEINDKLDIFIQKVMELEHK